jgi:hypothetical protein
MPYPPRQPVVPLREGLLDPLHDHRKLHPVLRLDIEREPVILLLFLLYAFIPAPLKKYLTKP